jgi:hypothetical protein
MTPGSKSPGVTRAILLAFLLGPIAAAATPGHFVPGAGCAKADAPTQQQIQACRSDALRYCAAFIGDEGAMRSCMVAHKRQLSQECKDAFDPRH